MTRIVPRRRVFVFTGFLAGMLLPTSVVAAPPAEPLLNHVPADAGICVIVQNLRERSQTLSESPFADWFESSPLAARIVPETERGKFRAFETILSTQFNLTFDQIRDDILGDAIVFAYRPGPPDQPADEWGLLLIRPRKPILVERFFERLNELQLRSGEITGVRAESYRNQKYTIREKANGNECYLIREGIVAFSGQETAIQSWIDQLEAPAVETSVLSANLARMNVADSLITIAVQPRGFDRHLAARVESIEDPREQAFPRQFSKVWSACDALAVTVNVASTLSVDVSASFRRERVPEAVRPFLLAESTPSQFWPSIPEAALLAIAGRTSPLEAMTALDSFVPEGRPGIQKLAEHGLGPVVGRDRFVSVLRSFGPDWAFWIEPPAKEGKSRLPGGTAVIRLDGDESTRTNIEQGIELLFQLGRIAYNQANADQIELRFQRSGSRTIRTLVNDDRFPEGFQPAFTRDGDLLLFASSPALIERFQPPQKAGAEQQSTSVPVLRMSVVDLRSYLETHRKTLADLLARGSEKSVETITRELEQIIMALSPVDRLEVTRSTKADGDTVVTRYTLTITTIKPLAKQ